MSEKHKILTDDTGREIVNALNVNNQVLTALLQADTPYDSDWKQINANVVNGLGKLLYPVLSEFNVVAKTDEQNVLSGGVLPVRVIDHDVDLKKTPTGEIITPHTTTIEFVKIFYNSRLFSHGEKPYALTQDKTFKIYKDYYLPVANEYELFVNLTTRAGNYLAPNTFYELVDGAYVLTSDTYFLPNKAYYVQKYVKANVVAGDSVPLDVYYEKNHIHFVLYGTNCWRDSLLRMWLNSDKPKGEWWQPVNIFSVKPPKADKICGFLYGLPEEFKKCLVETEQTTPLPTPKRVENENYFLICDDEGENEVGKRNDFSRTKDKVFILSAIQTFATKSTDAEQPYEFYKKYSDHETYAMGADSNRIKLQSNGQAVTRYLRTPTTSNTYGIHLISEKGSLGNSLPNIYDYRCSPCFVLGNPNNL